MPDPEAVAEVARSWLRRARSDLVAARNALAARDELDPWVASFHAQQAAEKFLKAYLVAPVDGALAAALSAGVQLTDYGVDVRYPGDIPRLDADDAKCAVDCAAEVRDAVTSRLEPTL